jgi:protein arginine kinase activator
MKCQACGQPATVHVTELKQMQKRELHLCEACARKHQLVTEPQQELNLPAILQMLLGSSVGALFDDAPTCSACGLTYAGFRQQGWLGCPHDYEEFRSGLVPLLERLQRSIQHTGKVPRRWLRRHRRQQSLADLQQQLRIAIDTERYEDAARLRDQIRQQESADESE